MPGILFTKHVKRRNQAISVAKTEGESHLASSSNQTDYLHGYQSTEQERLCKQAKFLRHTVHTEIVVKAGESVLEIGCGVGAQLKILAEERSAKLVGIDRSPEQLERAKVVLAEEIASGQVQLQQGNAEATGFDSGQFDQIFIFFVLEHVSQPVSILREAKRLLKPGGRLTITEVHNPSLYIHPACQALDLYWNHYNRIQTELGGDPCVGVKLPNLAIQAGLQIKRFGPIGPVLDARASQIHREETIEFWSDLLNSVRGRFEQDQIVDSATIEATFQHLANLGLDPEAIVHYTGFQIVLGY